MLSDNLDYGEVYSSNFDDGLNLGPGHVLQQEAPHNPTLMNALARLEENCPAAPTSHAVMRWLTSPPSLEHYNKSVVNTFLKYCLANVGTDFEIFQDFRVHLDTPPETTLAMAAVGGLFCKVSGSFSMARAMYNDAHRILATKVCTDYSPVCFARVELLTFGRSL